MFLSELPVTFEGLKVASARNTLSFAPVNLTDFIDGAHYTPLATPADQHTSFGRLPIIGISATCRLFAWSGCKLLGVTTRQEALWQQGLRNVLRSVGETRSPGWAHA